MSIRMSCIQWVNLAFKLLYWCWGICLPSWIEAQESQVPVKLSFPQLTAMPGDTLQVPITISDVTGLGVLASNLAINYDARIMTAQRVIQAGTLTERWSIAHRVGIVEGSQDTLGLINIGLSTVNNVISGAGTLIKVEFIISILAQPGQLYPLSLNTAILNNRNPPTIVEHGHIKINRKLLGDFNNDGQVNFSDFLLFAQHFGTALGESGFDPVFDLDDDGRVEFQDFILFAQNFGR